MRGEPQRGGRMRATNRAAGRVLTHPTGLTPSSAATGEDLALMMPDPRHANQRALFAPQSTQGATEDAPTFLDVTTRPAGAEFGSLSATEWAERQFTGNQLSDQLLRALCSASRTPLGLPGPPWSWDGDLADLAASCGMTEHVARPYIDRLDELGITRFYPKSGKSSTDIGRYASQGDYVRWFKPPYKKVPARLRAAVLDRDGHRCQHCGRTDRLTIDHIFPQVYGGQSTAENLQVLCGPCNSAKGDST